MDENASVLPSFALSYPATVSVCAGVMTSTLLLIVHLGFSAQYHCPLCKMNYLLQASSTLAMLLRFTTELGIVLHDMREFAQMWPYMFPYLTYRLPHRSTWSTAQIFFWVLLKSINSLLAHVRALTYRRAQASKCSRCSSRRGSSGTSCTGCSSPWRSFTRA